MKESADFQFLLQTKKEFSFLQKNQKRWAAILAQLAKRLLRTLKI